MTEGPVASLADSYPHLGELRSILCNDYKFFRGVVDRGVATFGPAWAADFDRSLRMLFGEPGALGSAAKGYAYFVLDLLRRQRQFEKDRAYPLKSYLEAAQEVYLDDRYMQEEYLPGLVLSHFLWPHHYRQMQFFGVAFARDPRVESSATFAEVGIGTGLYSRQLLQRLSQVRGTGYDISPAANAFTQRHLRAFGLDDRYEVRLHDVLDAGMTPTTCIVCVEVLEHLEDPLALLHALRAGLLPGGCAFVTAALNAPHVDHIYLYERPEDVGDQLRQAGLEIEQYYVGLAHRPASPGLPVPSVAAFVVS